MPLRAPRRPLSMALALLCTASAMSVAAAREPGLTIYRDTGNALFSATADGTVDSGYAMVNEDRSLPLQPGLQTQRIDALPPLLDPQTLSLQSPDGAWTLRSSQLLPPSGNPALALLGKRVDVIGDNGQVLAQGTVVSSQNGLAIKDSTNGIMLIQHYAAIRSPSVPAGGASLQLALDAHRTGAAPVALSYATHGLGWRAVYQARLSGGDRCSLQLDAQASIGNRSGRDWQHVRVDLIAGTVNLDAEASARPVMFRAMAMAKTSSDSLPEQSALDAYRRYRLPATVDLPDQSITQLPLYPTQTIACQRSIQADLGSSAIGRQQPELGNYPINESPSVETRLEFTAPVNLPAGTIYVKTPDSDGRQQLLGSSRLSDTAAAQPIELTLGQSFQLTAHQQRLASHIDRARHQLDEQFQVTLDNAGSSGSQVRILAHPQRWSNWTVIDSNARAIKDGPSQTSFQLKVPAHGQTVLKYTIRYQWQAGDLPNGNR